MGAGMADQSDLADKCKKYLKFVYWGICILVICLSIAGISVAQTQLLVSQRLFIVILFFCFLALLLQGVYKLLKGSGQSKYEISERKMKKEQGAEKKQEKWVKNYVPYDEYPAGDTITVESETGEEKRREEEKGEKEEKEEKWKENYVPYEEKTEE